MTGEESPGTPVPAAASSEEERARAITLRSLAAAPRTRAQLEELLGRRGVPERVAEAVLDRFAGLGLVDDAAFAAAWVSAREARGLSSSAIRAELIRKGISREASEAALGEPSSEAERAKAEMLARRRLRTVQGLPRDAQVRRLAGMLARRGYAPGMAFDVVRAVLAEDAADPPD